MQIYLSQNNTFVIAFWRVSESSAGIRIIGRVQSNDIIDMEQSTVRTQRLIGFEGPAMGSFDELVEVVEEYARAKSFEFRRNEVVLSKLVGNTCYRRMWRGFRSPQDMHYVTPFVVPLYEDHRARAQSLTSASSLFSDFFDTLKYIEPHPDNFQTYGVRLRQLLILACTEVEACWRGVLVNNGYDSSKRLNTKDYILLKSALRLDQWSVAVKDMPDIGGIYPFYGWDHSRPSATLGWYSAYNAVKHDREKTLHQATFKNLFQAMAALYVMHAAQWGPSIFEEAQGSCPFRMINVPSFGLDEFPVYVGDAQPLANNALYPF